MNEKEKAVELVEQYKKQLHYLSMFNYFHDEAKQCALIAVGEVVKNEKQRFVNTRMFDNEASEYFAKQLTYWQGVINEIEKL